MQRADRLCPTDVRECSPDPAGSSGRESGRRNRDRFPRRRHDRMRAFGLMKGFNSRTIPLYPRIGSSGKAFISLRYVLASKTLGGSSDSRAWAVPWNGAASTPLETGRGWDTGRRIASVQGPGRALSDETKFLGVNVQSSRRIAGLSVTAWALKWRKTAPPLRSHASPLSCSRRPRCAARTMSGLTKLPTRAHAMTRRGKLRFPSRGQGHWAVDELGNVA